MELGLASRSRAVRAAHSHPTVRGQSQLSRDGPVRPLGLTGGRVISSLQHRRRPETCSGPPVSIRQLAPGCSGRHLTAVVGGAAY